MYAPSRLGGNTRFAGSTGAHQVYPSAQIVVYVSHTDGYVATRQRIEVRPSFRQNFTQLFVAVLCMGLLPALPGVAERGCALRTRSYRVDAAAGVAPACVFARSCAHFFS